MMFIIQFVALTIFLHFSLLVFAKKSMKHDLISTIGITLLLLFPAWILSGIFYYYLYQASLSSFTAIFILLSYCMVFTLTFLIMLYAFNLRIKISALIALTASSAIIIANFIYRIIANPLYHLLTTNY